MSNKDLVLEERQSKKHEELSTKKQRKPNTEKNANQQKISKEKLENLTKNL